MHPVCASKASTESNVNWKSSKHWSKLFRAILEHLKHVLHEFTQNDSLQTVLIAIDGVVPMAKIVQQRQRRFRSSYERQGIQTNWDSCLISPGTYFMKQFEQFFQTHMKELNQIPQFTHTKFILSSSKEFGEGEHKLMHAIRKLPKDTSIAMYGLDADLILLGITALSYHSRVHLFRENVHCALKEFASEDYVLMNIHILWDTLLQEII